MPPIPESLNLTEALAKCGQLGRYVHVEFAGGERALVAASVADLKLRTFRLVLSDQPPDESGDWLDGRAFGTLVRRVVTIPSTPATRTGAVGGTTWPTFPFPEMVRSCRQQGAGIMIGFDGGRAKFRRANESDLRARIYKFDWTERQTGNKDPSNWFGGDTFLAMLVAKHVIED